MEIVISFQIWKLLFRNKQFNLTRIVAKLGVILMKTKKNINVRFLKNISILLLVNLIITTIIFVMNYGSNSLGKIELFAIDWIFSNSVGFSIFFLLSGLEKLNLDKSIRFVLSIFAIVLGSLLGGFIGSIIIDFIFGLNITILNSNGIDLFLIISFIFGASAYIIFILLGRIHNKKIEWLQEREARTNAELISLRTRINPHFLFNTLNSISGLIYSEPQTADAILLQLSELLRYTLYAAELPMVEIDKELEVVEQYLNIESIRLDKRLSYKIINEVKNFKLPPLIILTLVENAIKHGISPNLEGGEVTVSIKYIDDDIIITVSNSGDPLIEKSAEGFGLNALQKLLKINYADKALFNLKNEKGITKATILFKGINNG